MIKHDSKYLALSVLLRQVRVYDPSTPQRRPVLEARFGEYPLTALSLPASEGTVVVGNTHGELAILDLRKGKQLVDAPFIFSLRQVWICTKAVVLNRSSIAQGFFVLDLCVLQV